MTTGAGATGDFAATIDLGLRPSLRALRLVFCLHALCIGLLPLAMQPGWPAVLLAGAFAGSWLWLRRHPALGFGKRAIDRIVWHADGGWSLWIGRREIRAELRDESLIHRRLLVLRFRAEDGRRYTRLIAGDEGAESPLRRLRARLSVG